MQTHYYYYSDFYTHNTFNPFHNYLQLGLLALCLWFLHANRRLKTICDMPKTTDTPNCMQ